MRLGAQIVSIIFAVLVFGVVFEMVRRRYLRERYALLWLTAALALIILAAWNQLLDHISALVGIATPSNAFFVIAFAFLLLLLLHFSTVVSRMSDETRVLAQRLALLEQRQQATERERQPEWVARGDDAASSAAEPVPTDSEQSPTNAGARR